MIYNNKKTIVGKSPLRTKKVHHSTILINVIGTLQKRLLIRNVSTSDLNALAAKTLALPINLSGIEM